jgi:ferric-dicitrate binding protein FerR (iron transport regulator)
MTDTSDYDKTAPGTPERDALAELIRAAGRRPAPRAADYERVLAASRVAWQAKLRAHRRRYWYALAAVLALVAVGLVSMLLQSPAPIAARAAIVQGQVESLIAHTAEWTPVAAGAAIREGARVRTVGDGRAAFELAAGVSLRASNATEWVFAGPRRIELAAGTLYVDSGTTAAARGVEIATAFGVVRDVGTQFEVRALATGLRIRVREGLAELLQIGKSDIVPTAAGEQLAIDGSGRMQRSTLATDDTEWAWTQSLATPPRMEGRSAFEVLEWVARESGKRLVFADTDVERRLHGAILHGESRDLEPLEVLDVLVATTGGLDYALGEETLIITRR